MKSFFTPKDVSNIIGISYRQIQYWDKTNFIKPSYRRKGKYRLYTFADLIQLRLANLLRSQGFPIQRLRKTIKSFRNMLPQVNCPLVELTVLIEGDRILIFDGEVVVNNTAKWNYVRFDISKLRDDVDNLYPEQVPEIA